MTRLEWVERPWGAYTVVAESPEQTVKLLVVDPGQEISLQTHEHRSESWAVLEGVATFTIGDEVLTSQSNEVYTVPKGVKHRVSNLTETPVGILEIITGLYDEKDIVRLEDRYGRN